MINEKFIESLDEYATELYTEDEIEAVEAHIRSCFGEYPNMFHEIMSPDIHVDICVIPPENGRNYYTLVTMGMGAHLMNVPEDLSDRQLRRAELLITLPPDWPVVSEDERWQWPVRLLKAVSRLPLECDTWLGWGHTVDNGGPFSCDTKLCSSLLVSPQCGENELNADAGVCILPNGDEVNFYHLIPIYEREMQFKKMYGAEALISYALSDVSHVIDIDRPDGCADWDESDDMSELFEEMDGLDELDELMELAGFESFRDFEAIAAQGILIDDAEWHADTIRRKKLPVDELNAFNHIAIYMRWCMERDLVSKAFLFRHVNMIDDIAENGFNTGIDLRVYIRDSGDIRGCLISPYFSETGAAFTGYYYIHGSEDGYPADIDAYGIRYTKEHFGEERCKSGEFMDEEYLFVPYTEEYYLEMKKCLDMKYNSWRAAYIDRQGDVLN